jgi:hypothetical protein
MDPSIIEEENGFEPGLYAVIIYDDLDCAAKANVLFQRAAHRADESPPWTVKPWRLDLLKRPLTAGVALADAAGAHLVLFSVRHAASLPAWVFDWLEQWAERRRERDVALAVLDGGYGATLFTSAVPELFEFAERQGLSFIFGDAGRVGDDLPVLVRDLHEREAAPTPLMKSMRECAPLVPAGEWNIHA